MSARDAQYSERKSQDRGRRSDSGVVGQEREVLRGLHGAHRKFGKLGWFYDLVELSYALHCLPVLRRLFSATLRDAAADSKLLMRGLL